MNSEIISIAELLGCQPLYRSRSLFSLQLLPAQANSAYSREYFSAIFKHQNRTITLIVKQKNVFRVFTSSIEVGLAPQTWGEILRSSEVIAHGHGKNQEV